MGSITSVSSWFKTGYLKSTRDQTSVVAHVPPVSQNDLSLWPGTMLHFYHHILAFNGGIKHLCLCLCKYMLWFYINVSPHRDYLGGNPNTTAVLRLRSSGQSCASQWVKAPQRVHSVIREKNILKPERHLGMYNSDWFPLQKQGQRWRENKNNPSTDSALKVPCSNIDLNCNNTDFSAA